MWFWVTSRSTATWTMAVNVSWGAALGRYANRIAGGHFTLDGKEYTLPQNDNGQTLHGGLKGFDSVVWDVESATDTTIVFRYRSADGEEGFPGNLDVTMASR